MESFDTKLISEQQPVLKDKPEYACIYACGYDGVYVKHEGWMDGSETCKESGRALVLGIL